MLLVLTAADQNFGAAQIDSSIMLINSEDEENKVEAVKWAILGKINGDDRADNLLKYIDDHISEEIINEGASRADKFYEGN